MSRNYTVSTKINKPVSEVFNAVISRDILARYFVSEADSDLVAGQRVRWRWHHHDGHTVVVNEVVENTRIELTLDSREWEKTKTEAYDVRVIFEFAETDDGGTIMSISEQGWKTDADGLKGSHDNCGGWKHMAMCMKAWLEHGIDLR